MTIQQFDPDKHIEETKFIMNTFRPIGTIIHIKDAYLVGSTAILGKGEDTDIAVLIDKLPTSTTQFTAMGASGWEFGGSCDNGSEFESWKKDGVNLIFVDKPEFFALWKAATLVAKAINKGILPIDMTIKQSRIDLHRIIFGELTI